MQSELIIVRNRNSDFIEFICRVRTERTEFLETIRTSRLIPSIRISAREFLFSRTEGEGRGITSRRASTVSFLREWKFKERFVSRSDHSALRKNVQLHLKKFAREYENKTDRLGITSERIFLKLELLRNDMFTGEMCLCLWPFGRKVTG